MIARRLLGVFCSAATTMATTVVHAQPVVQDGLRAFLDFEEGSGQTSADRTGNGHHATLVGGTTWGDGYAHVHSGGDMVRVASSSALRATTFTYDLWFEANGSSLGGRLLNQSKQIGGHGPDLLEWYGRRVTFRLTKGAYAVFDTPSVGSITSSAPPDHLAQCSDAFHKKEGPEHLVFVHDDSAKRVQVFQGLEGHDLELVYDGTYSGSYSVTSSDLTLGNVLTADHVHPSRFYQFAYYGKALSRTLSGRVVTGGEIFTNHQAGPDVDLYDPPEDPADPNDPGDADCDDLRSTEYGAPMAELDVYSGDPSQLLFHVPAVPDPSQLTAATLTMRLHDADHPGEEGQVFVNGHGPLDLPAAAAWDDADADASLAVPVTALVAGTNVIAFGGGSRDRTVYEVGDVALAVQGPACEPVSESDAAPPDGDDGAGGRGAFGEDGGTTDDAAELPADDDGASAISGQLGCSTTAGISHGAWWAVVALIGAAGVTLGRRRRRGA